MLLLFAIEKTERDQNENGKNANMNPWRTKIGVKPIAFERIGDASFTTLSINSCIEKVLKINKFQKKKQEEEVDNSTIDDRLKRGFKIKLQED